MYTWHGLTIHLEIVRYFIKKVQIVESPSEVSLICAIIRIIQSPAVDVSGNNVSVVWLDNTAGNFEILLRKSVNVGDAFGSTVNYSHSTGDSIAPTIAVSPNNF